MALLLFFGPALALEAPEALEAASGGFLSVPVRGEGKVVALEVPPGLILLSEGVEGEGVLNFLVTPQAPAGEHLLRLKDAREERAVRVRVLPRAGLSLRLPPGGEGVEGETLRYTLLVQNTGNAPDRVRLEARSLLPHRLLPEVLDLAPGEAKEAVLELRLVGRNRDTATLFAYSSLDPGLRVYGVVETVVRPFAGAEALSRQALYYRLGLGAQYRGSLVPSLSLGLQGALSDFVRLSGQAAYTAGELRGEVGLSGEGFGLGFRAYGGLYRLEGELGPLDAYLAWSEGGLVLGGGYAEDPWRARLSLSPQGQRFSLGYALREGGLTLVPYGVLQRRTDPLALQGGGGVEGSWEERTFSLSGRLEYLDGLRFYLAGGSRAQEPQGLKGAVAYAGGRLQASFSLSERLDEATRQGLTLRLAEGIGGVYTLAYRPPASPFSLQGSLGYQGGFFAGLSARYREGGLEVGGSLAQASAGRSFSLYAAYREEAYQLQAGFTATPEGRRLDLSASAAYPPLEGRLRLGYDPDGRALQGFFGLLYREGPLGLGAEAAYQEGDWRVTLQGLLELRGGFDTPEAVVQAFGGRATGFLEGRVFHDLNRDGLKGVEEPLLAGVKVRVGALEAVTDASGRFRLELYPGAYALQVGGVEASLALRRNLEFRVRQGETLSLDVPLETVVGLTGQVFLDRNRNGVQDEDEPPLPFVRVRLQGPEARTALANDRGGFLFANLLPGTYTLSLDPASLDELQEPGEPLNLTLAPGPLPRVLLWARPVERKVVTTFTEESLGLVLSPLPPVLPVGGEVRLQVRVQGRPDRVWAELGGRTYPLAPQEGGYEAYLPVEAEGALPLKVVAERGQERAEASTLVVARPGPLASLQITPALLDPKEEAQIEARLLRRAQRVEVRIGPLVVPLEAVDPFTYRGRFQAPETPGAYQVELYLDGKLVATGRFRVRE